MSPDENTKKLTRREIPAGVRERLLLLEDRVRLHLVAGAGHQIADLVLERAVRHRNRAHRTQRVRQIE